MKRRTEKELMKSSPLAAFVRQKRKNMALTQEEFALRVGVGLAFLKRLETGDQSLQYAKVIQVLDYLGAELIPVEKSNE